MSQNCTKEAFFKSYIMFLSKNLKLPRHCAGKQNKIEKIITTNDLAFEHSVPLKNVHCTLVSEGARIFSTFTQIKALYGNDEKLR